MKKSRHAKTKASDDGSRRRGRRACRRGGGCPGASSSPAWAQASWICASAVDEIRLGASQIRGGGGAPGCRQALEGLACPAAGDGKRRPGRVQVVVPCRALVELAVVSAGCCQGPAGAGPRELVWGRAAGGERRPGAAAEGGGGLAGRPGRRWEPGTGNGWGRRRGEFLGSRQRGRGLGAPRRAGLG